MNSNITINNRAEISASRKYMLADFKLDDDHKIVIIKVYMDSGKKWNRLSKDKRNAVKEFLVYNANELQIKHNTSIVLTFKDCGTEVKITFIQKQ